MGLLWQRRQCPSRSSAKPIQAKFLPGQIDVIVHYDERRLRELQVVMAAHDRRPRVSYRVVGIPDKWPETMNRRFILQSRAAFSYGSLPRQYVGWRLVPLIVTLMLSHPPAWPSLSGPTFAVFVPHI